MCVCAVCVLRPDLSPNNVSAVLLQTFKHLKGSSQAARAVTLN